MNDVRDEALGVALERVAKAIEAEPVDRLTEVLRRGARRRTIRFTAVSAAVAVFVGAVAWAGISFRDADVAIPGNVADWDTFASIEENGWTVQVPPSWRIQELPACPNAPERIGVVVTNTDFEFLNPRRESPQCGERFVFQGFPSDGVAFAFMPRGIIQGLSRPPTDTALPLSTDLLFGTGGITGGPAESFASIWVKTEAIGVVRRWVGNEAASRDIAALDQMLESFSARGALRWVNAAASTPRLRVRITRPEDWNVTRFPGVTVIDAPQPILMVTTPEVREGYSFCLGGPWGEFTTLGRSGVVVAISDATSSWIGRPELGPRPASFKPSEARYDDTVTCSGDVRRLSFQFEEAGRPIVVNVLVATSYLREQSTVLWHILNSIRITKP